MSAHELTAAPAPGGEPRPDENNPDETHLSVAGVSPDGKQLLLTDGDGGAFALDVDARLRAAVNERPESTSQPAASRRESPMDVQREAQSESLLRPRDIQARVRAGESAEQVAAAAQTTVEKVMPYAGPVLAEREHIAGRAQKSSVRRSAAAVGADGGARTLGDVVTARLRTLDVDPTDLVEWDAWRREDGRWALTGRYAVTAPSSSRQGLGEFTFDPPGNFVTLDNDDARWLVGDLPDAPAAPEPPHPGVRRLAAVVDRDPALEGQLSIDDELGLDAVGLVAETPVEAFLDDRPDLEESEPAHHEPPPRRPVRKTRGRASVPSWDEIMFGGKPD